MKDQIKIVVKKIQATSKLDETGTLTETISPLQHPQDAGYTLFSTSTCMAGNELIVTLIYKL